MGMSLQLFQRDLVARLHHSRSSSLSALQLIPPGDSFLQGEPSVEVCHTAVDIGCQSWQLADG